MDVNAINPILASFTEVLPLLGFSQVTKKKVSLAGSTLAYDGILLNVAVVGSIKGVLLIGMSFEDAKKFASKMMMGMEVSELDSLAQSAISEMANMVCANACTQFSKADIGGLDISPPTLMMGTGGMATLPVPQAIVIDFDCDGIEVKLYVGLA